MNKTKIEWVKNPDYTGIPARDTKGRFQYQGYTWNPITGCLNGCEYCYARKLANGRLKSRYLANTNIAPIVGAPPGIALPIGTEAAYNNPFYPRLWEDRLKSRKQGFGDYMSGPFQKGIFVCDMSDLFGIGIPEEWTRRVLENIGQPWYKEHRFYLLTKQPQNLIKWSPFPENCWCGVTATNQEMFIDALMELAKVTATVKYISFEPLLEGMNGGECEGKRLDGLTDAGIKWVIIGSQTKPYKPPKIEWVEEIVTACDKAGIPVFLKENLMVEKDKALEAGLWNLERRQEMPNVRT